MKKEKPFYHSIIISDVHLGTRDSKAKELISFLKATRCKKLILNGDIIDGWALRGKHGRWMPDHTKLIRTMLKKIEKQGTEVIYLRGNHDDILERFLPIDFGNLQIKDEYIHETPLGKYLVVHGDGFDSVTTDYRWVAWLGSVAYEFLLKLNRFYNRWREFRGKPFYSLSKEIKRRVKSAVSFIGRYEDQLTQLAKHRKCSGIICGHIHTPADKQLEGGIHYLNSGDWVESLTAVIEPVPGQFELIEFEEYMSRDNTRAVAEESKELFEDEANLELEEPAAACRAA